MNFLTEAEREGWIGWLANPPPLGQHIQKVNPRKNKRNYLGPQKCRNTCNRHACKCRQPRPDGAFPWLYEVEMQNHRQQFSLRQICGAAP